MGDDDDTVLTVRDNARPRCGAYELVRELGSGGMGTVWEGRHSTLGRRVAVKVLHERFTRNPELLARFIREGMAAARIEHPHVASVYDVGQEDHRAWLVMELLEGEDLGALLNRETRVDAARAVDLMLPVLAALAEAHAAGVVHRDLKPGNIFLARDRAGVISPKVVDFGFSKIRGDDPEADPELTRPDTALGTLAYMPLEQVRASREATAACDQYALGVTLYRCVTGRLPFDGATQALTFKAILRGVCPRPSELVPGLPPGLDDVILRAMYRSPEGRYPSARDFGAALVPFASPVARARWAETFGVVALASPSTAPPLTHSGSPALASSVPGRALSRGLMFAVIAGAVALAVGVIALAAFASR